jgi:hypothetical protein
MIFYTKNVLWNIVLVLYYVLLGITEVVSVKVNHVTKQENLGHASLVVGTLRFYWSEEIKHEIIALNGFFDLFTFYQGKNHVYLAIFFFIDLENIMKLSRMNYIYLWIVNITTFIFTCLSSLIFLRRQKVLAFFTTV